MFATFPNAGVPATLAGMIRRGFGAGAAKIAAPYAEASDRTVSDWLQRRAEPGAWRLIRMLRHPGFRAELRAYLDLIENQEAAIAIELERVSAERLGAGVGVHGPRGSSRRPAAVCVEPTPASVPRRTVKG